MILPALTEVHIRFNGFSMEIGTGRCQELMGRGEISKSFLFLWAVIRRIDLEALEAVLHQSEDVLFARIRRVGQNRDGPHPLDFGDGLKSENVFDGYESRLSAPEIVPIEVYIRRVRASPADIRLEA